jgi:hypothetical protein
MARYVTFCDPKPSGPRSGPILRPVPEVVFDLYVEPLLGLDKKTVSNQCRNSKLAGKSKTPIPVFSPPKLTRAPPWRFPPKIQSSCLPKLRSPTIPNLPTVKLLTICRLVAAPYSCLPGCSESHIGCPLTPTFA